MTLLVLPHPPAALPWLRPLLAGMLSRLAGRSTDLPERLEDWQLRDLNLTRPQRSSFRPGPDPLIHYDLP